MKAIESIEQVEKAVRRYRKLKTYRYPSAVWKALGELKKRHDLAEISKRTGISVCYLQRKLGDGVPVFCELAAGVSTSNPVSIEATAGVGSAIVEIRRPDGNQLVARVVGANLSDIISRFIQT